ncbi:MAG: 30S ribosomal protein S4e [Candidatus Altiarchaeota archaeon]|nr:30S ribosomal protein S4e [Candidatus Altiarchaeota archaeon]
MIRHTKRVTSPTFWGAGRKNFVWITSPAPGPHPAKMSIPLQVLIRDVLKLVRTGREARAAIHEGHVLVDGVIRKEHKFPVGLMDVISFPALKKQYRTVPYDKGLKVIEISDKDSKVKPVRVVTKQAVSGGKIQVTSHDGGNYLGVSAKVGDTLLIKDKKVNKILEMKQGALCLVFRGRQAGRMGKLVKFDGSPANSGLARLKGGNEVFEAPVNYLMVIGEDKPVVKLYEESSN